MIVCKVYTAPHINIYSSLHRQCRLLTNGIDDMHGQYARAPTSEPDNDLFPRAVPTPPDSPPLRPKSISDHDLINIPLSVTSSPDDGEKPTVPKKRAGGGSKLLYLEGLRGLAALWVVNEHFSELLHLFPDGFVRGVLRVSSF